MTSTQTLLKNQLPNELIINNEHRWAFPEVDKWNKTKISPFYKAAGVSAVALISTAVLIPVALPAVVPVTLVGEGIYLGLKQRENKSSSLFNFFLLKENEYYSVKYTNDLDKVSAKYVYSARKMVKNFIKEKYADPLKDRGYRDTHKALVNTFDDMIAGYTNRRNFDYHEYEFLDYIKGALNQDEYAPPSGGLKRILGRRVLANVEISFNGYSNNYKNSDKDNSLPKKISKANSIDKETFLKELKTIADIIKEIRNSEDAYSYHTSVETYNELKNLKGIQY